MPWDREHRTPLVSMLSTFWEIRTGLPTLTLCACFSRLHHESHALTLKLKNLTLDKAASESNIWLDNKFYHDSEKTPNILHECLNNFLRQKLKGYYMASNTSLHSFCNMRRYITRFVSPVENWQWCPVDKWLISAVHPAKSQPAPLAVDNWLISAGAPGFP